MLQPLTTRARADDAAGQNPAMVRVLFETINVDMFEWVVALLIVASQWRGRGGERDRRNPIAFA